MAVQFGSPSIVKELSFKEDAKSKLIAGIDKLAEAVGSTAWSFWKNSRS